MNIDVRAPFGGSMIATLEAVGKPAVEVALAGAHRVFRGRDAWLPVPTRIAILRQAAVRMEGQVEKLAVTAAREGGKPLADSRVRVAGVHSWVEEAVAGGIPHTSRAMQIDKLFVGPMT
jgi:acyl-CoA reductase-like NAD-dependent aldehyde dehydrogenase